MATMLNFPTPYAGSLHDQWNTAKFRRNRSGSNCQRSLIFRLIVYVVLLAPSLLLNACGGGGFSAESSAELVRLDVSAGRLQPAFEPSQHNYALIVDPTTEAITVSPTAVHDAASIKVNGESVPSSLRSAPVPVISTPASVTIEVVSPDQLRTTHYALTVIHPGQEDLLPVSEPPTGGDAQPDDSVGSEPGDETSASQSARLASLELHGGQMVQVFDGNLNSYDIVVPALSSLLEVNATAVDAAASISIASGQTEQGHASALIETPLGASAFAILVTSGDQKNQQRYAFNVQRAATQAFGVRQVLSSSQPITDGQFGFSQDMSGNWLAIGAPTEADSAGKKSQAGGVYLYQAAGDQWIFRQRLQAPAPKRGEQFGYSVALDGQQLAIGSFGADEAAQNGGRVDLYALREATWTHQQALEPPQPGENHRFGFTLALHDNLLAIAELRSIEGADQGGRVYTYRFSAAQGWALESTIITKGASDRFAQHVALTSEYLAIGTFDYDGECKLPVQDPGAVIVYQRQAGGWSPAATLTASNADGADRFGFSLTLSGERLVVGAICEDSQAGQAADDNSATQTGAAYVFTRQTDGQWQQETILKPTDAKAHDLFGYRLKLIGDTLIASAPLKDKPARDAGGAYIFQLQGAGWQQQAEISVPEASVGDILGISLGFSNGRFALGATQIGAGNPQSTGRVTVF